MADKDWKRVGDAVRTHRERLGLDQRDIPGVSAATMRKIERGEQTSYKSFTLRRVEAALGWPDGTIDRIGAGGDPPGEGPTIDLRLAQLEQRLDTLTRQVESLLDGA